MEKKFDRSSAWYKSLPPESCAYTTSKVRIPMSDGLNLVADLYEPSGLPSTTKPHGLILVISCYSRGGVMSMMNAVIFAARGYTVLFASSRGTFGSEGVFVPGMSEETDSQDIVKWMRNQPWYPGKFATFGASYLGYTQWALLQNPPEDLVASIILAAPHDHARHNWDKGVFRMDRIAWNYLVAFQEELGAGAGRFLAAGEMRDAVYNALPLIDAVEGFFKGKAPWMRQFMTTTDIDDVYWRPVNHSTALDRVNIPILLGSGWYDCFNYQTFSQYKRLRDRGCKVDLTVGSWTHFDACGIHSMVDVLDFLGHHLTGREEERRVSSVKIYVTGAEAWRDLATWPPSTELMTFFLQGDKSLSKQDSGAEPLAGTFVYDPQNPTPTLGGCLLGGGGRVDDTAYTSRSDVLVYTGQPLIENTEVMGRPSVHLTHTTDIPYADLWVRLSEVDIDGVSHNVTETFQALNTKPGDVSISLELQDCAHVFKKGTCIRLVISGGSFPLMARNLGTEGNRTMKKEMRSVTHSIQHDGMSRLELPCLSTT